MSGRRLHSRAATPASGPERTLAKLSRLVMIKAAAVPAVASDKRLPLTVDCTALVSPACVGMGVGVGVGLGVGVGVSVSVGVGVGVCVCVGVGAGAGADVGVNAKNKGLR